MQFSELRALVSWAFDVGATEEEAMRFLKQHLSAFGLGGPANMLLLQELESWFGPRAMPFSAEWLGRSVLHDRFGACGGLRSRVKQPYCEDNCEGQPQK
jgi:hypothetical protein